MSNFQISHQTSALWDETISVNVDVTNTGLIAGEEVAQLYVSVSNGTVDHNKKDLKDFKKIYLESGETKTVTFEITPDKLYYFSEQNNRYEIDPATYTFYVGNASDSLQFSHTINILPGSLKPDLQIANVYSVPRYPIEGDTVIFLATILNRGAGISPSSTYHEISFKVNNKLISRSVEFADSISTGGMALLCGNVGENNINYWIAEKPGKYSVEAFVDDNNLISEINESNNSKTVSLEVYNAPPENLALNKTVIVSSVESSSYAGRYAVDGNPSTRWSSQFSDPQMFTLDLGQLKHFNQIRIVWEAAYGKDYIIEVSEDGSTWNKLVEQIDGFGGIEKWNVDANARFIRLTGTKRSTEWGYSIYEFEVYYQDTSSSGDGNNLPKEFLLYQNYPNPFNSSTKINYAIAEDGLYTLKVFNILGQEVKTLFQAYCKPGNYNIDFNANDLSSGVYIYQLSGAKKTLSSKMILMK
jgi:hypothetical protein